MRRIVSKSLCLFVLLIPLLCVPTFYISGTRAIPVVSLTAATDKASYYIREPIALGGNLTEGGAPAVDYLASIEVDNHNGKALLYRTVPVGNPSPAPSTNWKLQITGISIKDGSGTEANSLTIPTPVYQFNQLVVGLRNKQGSEYKVNVTMSILDGNLIPIAALPFEVTMLSLPYEDQHLNFQFVVPEWAYSGQALAVVNVYDNLPRDGGFPIIPESRYVFYLTRNPNMETPYSVLPAANTSSPGQYGIAFRMPPDYYTMPGTYDAYASAVSPTYIYLRSTARTSFVLTDYSSPPSAAFSFSPLQIYGGMNVTFDASSSSAEGPNVTITSYEWTITHPNSTVIFHTTKSTPTVLYAFASSGTYSVKLNVTNSVGLWATAEKPVVVLPDSGPTANFAYTPLSPTVNHMTTFNASSSLTGWSTAIPGYAPIATYTWNFSDGTPITTSNNTIQHNFTTTGNFTVTLTVNDTVSRTDTTSRTISVANRTLWDINGDGITDMRDIALAAKAFATKPGDPLWNPDADITGPIPLEPDGTVDMRDISLVARHFGEHD